MDAMQSTNASRQKQKCNVQVNWTVSCMMRRAHNRTWTMFPKADRVALLHPYIALALIQIETPSCTPIQIERTWTTPTPTRRCDQASKVLIEVANREWKRSHWIDRCRRMHAHEGGSGQPAPQSTQPTWVHEGFVWQWQHWQASQGINRLD